MVLSLLKSSQCTFSQASNTWSRDHRPGVICFLIALEESLEAVKAAGQLPSWANCQALEFPKSHSFSAAKALLTKNAEFIIH